MSRNDFLKNLREALSQSLDNQTVNNQIDYYDKYISDEINKGRSESEVLDELGDPRLIAKTIQTVNRAGNVIQDGNTDNTYNSNNQNAYNNNNQNTYENQNRNKTFYTNMSSTSIIGCVIVLLVLFIIVAFILQMFGVVFMGLTGIISKTGIGFIVLIAIMVWLVLRRK